MAFVLKADPGSYYWPVSIDVPTDGGRFKRETFEVEFQTLPQSELEGFQQDAAEDSMKDSDFCRRVVMGWKNIIDEDGNELPYSLILFEQMIDLPLVAAAITRAYFESLQGRKAKN